MVDMETLLICRWWSNGYGRDVRTSGWLVRIRPSSVNLASWQRPVGSGLFFDKPYSLINNVEKQKFSS